MLLGSRLDGNQKKNLTKRQTLTIFLVFQKDLALLMMDDDAAAGKLSHFDSRDALKQKSTDGSEGKKKLSRWKLSKLKAKEKRLAKQGVVISNYDTLDTKPALPTLGITAVSAFSIDVCKITVYDGKMCLIFFFGSF